MKLTRLSINNPAIVAVISAVILLLGIAAMLRIPAQLLPNIEKPIITIINSWPGASPSEIESEVTVPVEEVLIGTPGMTDLVSWNFSNFGFMQMEFAIETDMTRALIEVISRLNRLRPLPANAQKPQVMMGEWGDFIEMDFYNTSTGDCCFQNTPKLFLLSSYFFFPYPNMYPSRIA